MPLSFERTRDYGLVRQIITHPLVYRAELLSDQHPAREDYRVPMGEEIWHVLAVKEYRILGIYTFIEDRPAWEAHVAMLPGAWGSGSAARGLAATVWLGQNSKCRRLFCLIPEFNRSAIAFIRRCGWEEVGIDRSWVTKGGEAFLKIRFETAVPV